MRAVCTTRLDPSVTAVPLDTNPITGAAWTGLMPAYAVIAVLRGWRMGISVMTSQGPVAVRPMLMDRNVTAARWDTTV